jgi:hypothetical protein
MARRRTTVEKVALYLFEEFRIEREGQQAVQTLSGLDEVRRI